MRSHEYEPSLRGKSKRRFDDDAPYGQTHGQRYGDSEPGTAASYDDGELFDRRGHRRHLEAREDSPDEGARWSTWDQSSPTERGPRPYPDWLVTELAAVDIELGILKTGKEADVFLVERRRPGHRSPLPAGRETVPDGRAPHVPPRRRLPRGAPGPRIPGQPGHGGRVRPSARRPSPASGRWPSSTRCAGSTARGVPRAVPGADPRHRGAAGVHRRRDVGPRRAWLSCGRTRPTCPTCGSTGRRRSPRWRGPGSPTGTCRRTTCSSTMDGWSSSICPRSST